MSDLFLSCSNLFYKFAESFYSQATVLFSFFFTRFNSDCLVVKIDSFLELDFELL